MLDFNHRPTPAERIVEAIDSALEAQHVAQKPRDYLGASRIGADCNRALQYEYPTIVSGGAYCGTGVGQPCHYAAVQDDLERSWGFLSHLTAWCEKHSIPYSSVPVGTIKQSATGKGNASKEAVIQAMQALGHTPSDDNEADALALLHWAIKHHGGQHG